MDSPTIITITGDLGSGKSTVCDIMETQYGFDRYYTGRIQREFAKEKGMDTLQLNEYSKKDPEIDRKIDGWLQTLTHLPCDTIIDSRLAWHFVPATFKVYLTVDIREAAQRVLKDKGRGSVEQYGCIEDAIAGLTARKASEVTRFKAMYGVDTSDLGNYDLIVDTTLLTPEEIASIILTAAKDKQDDGLLLYTSPLCLYPTDISERSDVRSGLHAAATGEPIQIVLVDRTAYILDQHQRVAAFIAGCSRYVKCQVAARDDQPLPLGETAREYVQQNFSLEKTKAWEQANGFEYLYYPL